MASTFLVANPAQVPARPEATELATVKDMNERTRLLFMNDALSDATLIVGSNDTKSTYIPVHSLFLQSSSEVMAAMFSVNWKTSDPIRIKDFEASAIISLLRWVYCSELVFEPDHFLDLLRAAHKYMIHPLIRHVDENFNDFSKDFIWQVFDYATFHEHGQLRDKCLSFVGHRSSLQTLDLISKSNFEDITLATITAVVSDDKLKVDENTLFLQCLRWAKAECARNGKEVTPDHLRISMSPFIEELAFASMKPEDFASAPCESGVLSYKDQALVWRYTFNQEVIMRFRKGRVVQSPQTTQSVKATIKCHFFQPASNVAIYMCRDCDRKFCGQCLTKHVGNHFYSKLIKTHAMKDLCGGPPDFCSS